MDSEAIRAFANRAWDNVRLADDEHWSRETREHGPDAAVRACSALWVHMRRVSPGWPDERQRAEDLAHHVRMSELLRRTAHAITAR